VSQRPAHRTAAERQPQQAWLAFGGAADQAWLRPLRRGFRHCFAVLHDTDGWTVLDPLSGRLLVVRLDLPQGFDLPAFYRRSGLAVLGPYVPAPPRASWLPPLLPHSCVAVCRSVLGPQAPFAVTPHGLYRRLQENAGNRKNVLTQA
jgi:hypothetical protein